MGGQILADAPRRLTFAMCLALVVGNMIGSGVFLLPASLAPYGWNAVIGWLVTIAGALCLALTIAALARAMPQAGGPTGYVEAAFGRTPSFLIGWSYWVSIWTANVTLAVAAVSYLSVFAPAIGRTSGLPAALAIALLWTMTLASLRGARTAGVVQLATTMLKLVPLAVVAVIIALVLAREGGQAIAPPPREGFSLAAISASMALTLWALLGFESCAVAADKVEDPARTIPRATVAGTLITGLIYLVVCSGVALMLPAALATGSDAPFQLFVERFWAREPALLVALFAAINCLGALNGWVLLQGEHPLAMARHGLLPEWFGRTTARDVPANGLILSSVLATLLVIANSARGMAELFAFMALLSTSATLWLYLACAGAALRLKLAIPVAALGLGYALWTLWGAGPAPSGLSLALMASGLPLYWWARRNSLAASERSESISRAQL